MNTFARRLVELALPALDEADLGVVALRLDALVLVPAPLLLVLGVVVAVVLLLLVADAEPLFVPLFVPVPFVALLVEDGIII